MSISPSANAVNIKGPEVQLRVDTISLDKLNTKNHGITGITTSLKKVANTADYFFQSAVKFAKNKLSALSEKIRNSLSRIYYKNEFSSLDKKITKGKESYKTDKENKVNTYRKDGQDRVEEALTKKYRALNQRTANQQAIAKTEKELGQLKADLIKLNATQNTQRTVQPATYEEAQSFLQKTQENKDNLTKTAQALKDKAEALKNLQKEQKLLGAKIGYAISQVNKTKSELNRRYQATDATESDLKNLEGALQRKEEIIKQQNALPTAEESTTSNLVSIVQQVKTAEKRARVEAFLAGGSQTPVQISTEAIPLPAGPTTAAVADNQVTSTTSSVSNLALVPSANQAANTTVSRDEAKAAHKANVAARNASVVDENVFHNAIESNA